MSEIPPLWLIRARLRPDRGLAALGPLLAPAAPGARVAAAHRLVWSLFAPAPEARRDFLFREESPGRFLVLAPHCPIADHPLFAIDAPKPFAPKLRAGDRLTFLLRANPTIAVRPPPTPEQPRRRGKPNDAIWHALRATPAGEARQAARAGTVQTAGLAWLAKQGAARGFSPVPDRTLVVAHETLELPRTERGRPARLAVVDYAGDLTVTDPAAFVSALAHGFGRAKAFGCGLMLIKRARIDAG